MKFSLKNVSSVHYWWVSLFKRDSSGHLTNHISVTSQELEKLISFSGTPTCVWRRTGEICLVGDEFCLLTEWSKDELLDPHDSPTSDETTSPTDEHSTMVGCRKKFIYEVSPSLSP